MNKILVVAVALLSISSVGYADVSDKKVTVSWEYDQAKVVADKILGFRLKNSAGSIIAASAATTDRTVTTTVSSDWAGCQSFYLTAYTADEETGPSNIMTWCPAKKILQGVGKVTIEIKD